MRSHVFTIVAGLIGFSIASPVSFPLKNGFPNPNNTSLVNIEKIAKGTLSNGALPAKIDSDTITSFQLIAFNELFESAFFAQLLNNITKGVEGYEVSSPDVVTNLETILAQEELHALTANAVLANFKQPKIEACKYQFPVTDLASAVTLAQTFTDLVLGTLNDVQTTAATTLGKDGAGYVNALAPVIGQEGQQDGWFRILQRKTPSAQPFLTGAARAFAWNALQQFVVPGSCPNADQINLPLFGGLTLLTKEVADGCIEFEAASSYNRTLNASTQKLAYVTGANVPVVVPFNVTGNKISARFPLNEKELFGLTIAAVVDGNGPFSGPDDVANATVFGPGLIEVD